MFQIVQNEKTILKIEREKLGLTQLQVASRAGVQLRQYQRFETGERNLSSSSFCIACRVLEALGLDPTRYYRGEYALGAEVELDSECP